MIFRFIIQLIIQRIIINKITECNQLPSELQGITSIFALRVFKMICCFQNKKIIF